MNKQLKEKLIKLGPKYNISFIGVFGSYARGEEDRKSDLDLIVDFSKEITLLDLVRVEREFSENVGVNIDLLTEDSISPYIKDKIMKELKIIYEK